MHIGKNSQYKVGIDRYLANPLLPDSAKAILQAEREKCQSAERFCTGYAAGESPALPAWAAEYRDELVKLGLPAEYPAEEPERRRRR
jgi:hypothetical protein